MGGCTASEGGRRNTGHGRQGGGGVLPPPPWQPRHRRTAGFLAQATHGNCRGWTGYWGPSCADIPRCILADDEGSACHPSTLQEHNSHPDAPTSAFWERMRLRSSRSWRFLVCPSGLVAAAIMFCARREGWRIPQLILELNWCRHGGSVEGPRNLSHPHLEERDCFSNSRDVHLCLYVSRAAGVVRWSSWRSSAHGLGS